MSTKSSYKRWSREADTILSLKSSFGRDVELEKAGVKKIRVHDLRHSYVAYLINKGIEPILIKERVGHKDIRITLNTYGHLYPNQQRKVADMLDFEKEKSPNSGHC